MSTLAERMTMGLRAGMLAACVALVPSTMAFAQDPEIVAPRVLGMEDHIIRGQEAQPAIADSAIPEAAGDAVQLVERLEGLIFVTSINDILEDGVPGAQGVMARTNDVLGTPAFMEIANRYLGQPVSLRSLKLLTRDVVAFYAANGYPVVDVLTPEQDISEGVVQMVVFKGRLGEVRVEGNEHFSSEQIGGMFRMDAGTELRSEEVLSHLRWINNNPFRRVDLVYTPGAREGETDIILRTQDRRPFRVYGGYEDTGNDQTGYGRYLAGFNWGNVLRLDHQLNYQYTWNEDSNLFSAHSVNYVIPLRWRHTFSVFGSVAETNARPGSLPGGMALNLAGDTRQYSLRYGIPLGEISPGSGQEIIIGYDFKRTNNNLQFGGLTVLDTTADISQFVLGLNLSLPDQSGRTSFNTRVVVSPSGMRANDNNDAYERFNEFAEARYQYIRMELSRIQRLPKDMSLLMSVTAQLASTNLLGSEQLPGGGNGSVRGFDYRIANGDRGAIVNLELRTRSFSMGARGALQFLIFGDYARLSNKRVAVGDLQTVVLSSVGAGLRYSVDPTFSLRADWGYQLDAPPLPTGVNGFGRDGDHRLHLGVVLGF